MDGEENTIVGTEPQNGGMSWTTGHMTASAPEGSPAASSPSNCYFLINIKPDEERILCARFSIIILPQTNLQRIERSDFYTNPLEDESKYPLLPGKPSFKG